jgi:hypothetical protein
MPQKNFSTKIFPFHYCYSSKYVVEFEVKMIGAVGKGEAGKGKF